MQIQKFIILLSINWILTRCNACTTFLVGNEVTYDGSVLMAHSNDGDGGTAGNLEIIPRQQHEIPSLRRVSGGSIPQINETFKYLTKVGGYAALNEYQVGLAESTCVAKFLGNKSGILNIVDLSELAMERAKTSRSAIKIMGELAMEYGYNDNGESLFVSDPNESWVFHITPDDTKKKAIWAAQLIPTNHASVVANSFIIHNIDLNDKYGKEFLFSANIVDVAIRQKLWDQKSKFNFNRIYSGEEPGYKYSSGRRMWYAYKLLGISNLLPTYNNLQHEQPYNTSYPVPINNVVVGSGKITLDTGRKIMRSYYQNTIYDMSTKLSGGAFGTPDRWRGGEGEDEVTGHWERNIGISRSIISYILQLRNFLPNEIGATMWIAPHAAHTSVYVPFVIGQNELPVGYKNANVNAVGRGISAWQASRFVFNIAQMKFNFMIKDIGNEQVNLEYRSEALQTTIDKSYMNNNTNLSAITAMYIQNAEACVAKWWELSDNLILWYADGYCNGHATCMNKKYGTHLGYPKVWLEQMQDYRNGPEATMKL